MSTIELTHYTESMLRKKCFQDKPLIRMYKNGKMYLYKLLLKKMKCRPGDKILFSYDQKTNNWYISRSETDGLELKDAGSYNSFSIICSTHLRKEILETQQLFNNEEDTFYLCCSASPEIIQKGNVYYRINIIT